MKSNDEQYIPDGEWEGFYSYSGKGIKHAMSCFFTFRNGQISGKGSDDIGNYEWNGHYTESLEITLTKTYTEHSVHYKGDADENGIWGNWVVLWTTGGFHLWPIKQNGNIREHETQNIVQEELQLYL